MNEAPKHPWPPRYYEAEVDPETGDSVFAPVGLARSPWDPRAIAGGPISALLASAAENAELDEEFEIARFQVDIFGKVPFQPLSVATHVLRQGRQTGLHRLVLMAGGKPVAQAHVLRVRRLDTPTFPVAYDYPPPDSLPIEDGPSAARMAGAITMRRIEGGPGIPGRGVCWLAMNGQVIGGITPSPFVKACLFADFGNGFGNATPSHEWSFANLDITLQFLRMPVGDWFLIDAQTHMAGNGHGTASNTFADAHGVYARGFQTIFVAPGHTPPSVPQAPR
ncbi:thioesterase family protein [Novosphingobium sp. KCTC 2891]|uniref:thioesterase family protein n=1 Tax=Novosphingobium sp. KCTC 2891 TaxID=2989730 RepID=UPI0022239C8E|nr:thioesterase family protein [Novosphingobium sp. KCTC 2891]MCW1384802.1 thioesterase family protein [Novosphingobium sp. KCTC 2891]